MTFSDFINLTRIDQAKEMLLYTEDAVVNIAFKVGYNSVSYFNRIFKKITGIAPGDFRQKGSHTKVSS